LAIRRNTGEMEFNPDGDSEIHSGDFLIVMGKSTSLQQLEKILVKGPK